MRIESKVMFRTSLVLRLKSQATSVLEAERVQPENIRFIECDDMEHIRTRACDCQTSIVTAARWMCGIVQSERNADKSITTHSARIYTCHCRLCEKRMADVYISPIDPYQFVKKE